MQAKQVTCTSVKSFKPQGNNVLFYGYIREMAHGQTKLSIFNVPERVGGWERERERLFLSLPPPSLMNYQCFEVISMQGPDSKLGPLCHPCRHMSSIIRHQIPLPSVFFPQVLVESVWICILILIEKTYKSTNQKQWFRLIVILLSCFSIKCFENGICSVLYSGTSLLQVTETLKLWLFNYSASKCSLTNVYISKILQSMYSKGQSCYFVMCTELPLNNGFTIYRV